MTRMTFCPECGEYVSDTLYKDSNLPYRYCPYCRIDLQIRGFIIEGGDTDELDSTETSLPDSSSIQTVPTLSGSPESEK